MIYIQFQSVFFKKYIQVCRNNDIIIIIIGITAPIEPSLKKICQISPFLGMRRSGFHFFGFRNNKHFIGQGRQPCTQRTTGGPDNNGVSI
jgi:hypothetical protein